MQYLHLHALAALPQTRAENPQFGNHVPAHHLPVASQHRIHRRRRRVDQLHQDVLLPLVLGDRGQERRDVAAVDVVAAALALRLQHVVRGAGVGGCEANTLGAGERVLRREGGAQVLEGGGGVIRQECF